MGVRTPSVHYRLYRDPQDEVATVICVQDLDYRGYDPARFLSRDVWHNEAAAEAALLVLVHGRAATLPESSVVATAASAFIKTGWNEWHGTSGGVYLNRQVDEALNGGADVLRPLNARADRH